MDEKRNSQKRKFSFPRAESYPPDFDYLKYFIHKNPIVRYSFAERLKRTLEFTYDKIINSKIVVEIGPGPGYFFPTFSSFCDLVVGLDIEDRMLQALRYMISKENLRNISLIKGDILKLPFKENSVDLVVCMSVLEHVPLEAVSELHRIIKTKGSLIAGIPIDTFFSKMGRDMFGVGGHKHLINRYKEIRLELKRFFTITRKEKLPFKILPDIFSLYEICVCEKRI
jgi:ubiquinone/menaquinone biosynthesis C-methylase UbiE